MQQQKGQKKTKNQKRRAKAKAAKAAINAAAAAAASAASGQSASSDASSSMDSLTPPLNMEWLRQRAKQCHVQLDVDARCGRVLKATRAMRPGDVVADEDALLWSSWHEDVCIACGQVTTNTTTTTTIAAAAAGHDCDVLRDEFHPLLRDDVAQMTAELVELESVGDLDRARALIQAVNMCVMRPRAPECQSIMALQSSGAPRVDAALQAIRQSPLLRRTLLEATRRVDMTALLGVAAAEAEAVAKDTLLPHLLGVLNLNSHQMNDDGGGSGVFGVGSMFEHACTPAANCTFSALGHRLRIVAIADIAAGERVSIDYGNNIYEPRSRRREHLEHTYAFVCECRMCATSDDRTRVFQCTSCDAGEVYVWFGGDGDVWTCATCGVVLSDDEVRWLEEAEAELYTTLEQVVCMADVDAAAEDEKSVHPFHHVFYELTHEFAKLQSASSDPDELTQSAELWQRLAVMATRVLPEYHDEWIILHENYGQVCVAMGDRAEAVRAFDRAYRMACTTHTPVGKYSVQLKELVDDCPSDVPALLAYYARHRIE